MEDFSMSTECNFSTQYHDQMGFDKFIFAILLSEKNYIMVLVY